MAVNPTAVELAAFSSRLTKAKTVRAHWVTASEAQVIGFNVYRQLKGDKGWKKLNARLIPAKHPGEVVGADYRFNDRTVKGGSSRSGPNVYLYKLEVLRLDGSSGWSRSARVEVP